MTVRPLGKTPFNYQDYSIYRFIHYYQQIYHILKLNPQKMLEIGPGDHTVTDFFRRKGILLKTFDNDPALFPDYLGDIRELTINEEFDLVLASEVFEHLDVRWLDIILEKIKIIMKKGGHLVISLPYSTIRLFPERGRGGKILSFVGDSGRLYTFIPYYYIQPILTLMRGMYRLFIRRRSIKEAFRYYVFPEYPDDKYDVHHWDLGFYPTTRKAVRNILSKHFAIVEEKSYVNTNCVFYILKK